MNKKRKLAGILCALLLLASCSSPQQKLTGEALQFLEEQQSRMEEQREELEALRERQEAARAENEQLREQLLEAWESGGDSTAQGHSPEEELLQFSPDTAFNQVWFAQMADRFPEDTVHESWQSTENFGRLEQFAENIRNRQPDRVFLYQDGNPITHLFILWYGGQGDQYMIQPFFQVAIPEVLDTITFLDGYCYFTQGPVSVEDGVIRYTKDGESLEVPFETYPFADGQPRKVGENGSGWEHP